MPTHQISPEPFKAAMDAAWPGLPAGMSIGEAERRTLAALVAAYPLLTEGYEETRARILGEVAEQAATAESRPFPHGFARVQGRCPACRMSALFLGAGGYITCGNLQCTDPCAATEMLEQP